MWFGKTEFGGLGVPEIAGVRGAVVADGAVTPARQLYLLPRAVADAFGGAVNTARGMPTRATRQNEAVGPGTALVEAAARTFVWRFATEHASVLTNLPSDASNFRSLIENVQAFIGRRSGLLCTQLFWSLRTS
eukprot:SAG31_NODE_7927_length_1563_cov_0.661885_1_plen_132_part_10